MSGQQTVEERLAALEAENAALKAGQPLAKSEWELGMEALGTLAKASAVVPEELEFDEPPAIDDDELVQEMAKATPAGLEPSEGMSALPVLRGIVQGHNILVGGIAALGRDGRAALRNIGTLAKAQVMTMERQATVDAKLDELVAAVNVLTAGRLPRVSTLRVMEKATPAADAAKPAGAADESPRGTALLKAALDAEKSGRLPIGNASVVEYFVNRGQSLSDIAASNPALGSALEAQLKAAS